MTETTVPAPQNKGGRPRKPAPNTIAEVLEQLNELIESPNPDATKERALTKKVDLLKWQQERDDAARKETLSTQVTDLHSQVKRLTEHSESLEPKAAGYDRLRTERDAAVLAKTQAESAAARKAEELNRAVSRANTLRAFAEFCIKNLAAGDDSTATQHQRLFALKFLLTTKLSAELKNTEGEVYELMGVTQEDVSVWRGCLSAWGDVNAGRLVEIYAAPDSTLSDNKKWFLKNLLAIKFSIDLNAELRKIRERRQMEGPWHQS